VLGIVNQNGAFAEYVSIPVQNLHEIPESVDELAAVFVEPLAAALEITEQIHIGPAANVAVLGDGKLGLLICQTLKLNGCNLLLVGKHERKLALARSWGIATSGVADIANNAFDIVVEASGSAGGFQTALSMLRPRGTMVLKSTYHGALELHAAPLVVNEITVVGSRCGPFPPAIQLLAQQLIDVHALIEKVVPFEQAMRAFQLAEQHGTLKVILKIND
jgi:threonine dehydrogenase-like Zn-dependent dehydrogenase